MSAAPVIIAAGGTGGHVYPGLAVADALMARDVPVLWVGTPYGMEAKVVPAAGIPFTSLQVRGLRGNGLVGWLLAPLRVTRAVFGAVMLLWRCQPRVVLGLGGYVAGPVGVAAWLLRRPLVIQEQNAKPGMTNRWLSRLARRVLTGLNAPFPSAKAVVQTGNPVRQVLISIEPPAVRYANRAGERLRLLVLGGSLGARSLNQAVPAALSQWPVSKQPEIIHQAGQRTIETARSAYAAAGLEADVRLFIDDMACVYGWCDLVVCRAGALTISELAAVGVPALLVPFPYAVDDHQTANAQLLVSAGGAEILPDAALQTALFSERLEQLLADRDHLRDMAQKAHALAQPDAAQRVADHCLEVAA